MGVFRICSCPKPPSPLPLNPEWEQGIQPKKKKLKTESGAGVASTKVAKTSGYLNTAANLKQAATQGLIKQSQAGVASTRVAKTAKKSKVAPGGLGLTWESC